MCCDHANNQLKTLDSKKPIYFNICEDIEKIRSFYSGILGFKETGYCENISVEYTKNNKTIIFYQKDKAIFSNFRSQKESLQPFNWSIKADSNLFLKVFKLLNKAQPTNNEGLLTLDLTDPMGNKITVYLDSDKSFKTVS